MQVPRFDQGIAELPAGFDQEGAGAHRRVADFQFEDLLGVCPLAEPVEDRF